MANDNEAGRIFIDLVIKNTIGKQVQQAAQSSEAVVQKAFSNVGNKAGEALSKSVASAFNKSTEMAKQKLKEAEKSYEAVMAKMASIEDKAFGSAKNLNRGLKEPTVDRDYKKALSDDSAYQKMTAEADKAMQKLAQAEDRLSLEVENQRQKQVLAAEKAYRMQVSAAEKAEQKQAGIAQRVGEQQARAQERAAGQVARAQEKASTAAARAQERAAEQASRAQEKASAAAARAQERAASESKLAWKKSTKGITSLLKGVGRAIKSTFLMAGVYAALRGLRAMITQAANTNKTFEKSLGSVKANLASAFAPIMGAIMPALNTLMAGLARVTGYIAAFVNAVFGKTAKNAEKMSSAVSGAGGAAKKAAQNLAAFDQLNVLNKDDDSGGGGGAGEVIGETEIPKDAFDFVDKAKEKFKGFLDYLKTAYEPSINAWADAFGKMGKAGEEAMDRIAKASLRLQENGIKPLKDYMISDFFPSIANSFSTAFAPIFGDVMSALIKEFGKDFEFRALMMEDAINTILLPALKLFETMFTDIMKSIEDAWSLYGEPIIEGFHKLCDNIRGAITNLYETIIKPIITNLMNLVKSLWENHLKGFYDELMLMIGAIAEFLLAWWNEVLLPLVNWFIDTLGPGIVGAFNTVGEIIGAVVGGVVDIIKNLMSILRGLLTFLTGVFTGDWEKAWEGVKTIFTGVWNLIKDTFKSISNIIISIINGMIKGVTAGINTIIKAINKLKFEVPDWIPGIGGKSIGFNVPEVTPYQIPMLAGGGVIKQPTLAMMGEYSGAKSNPEIVTPQSILKETFAESIIPLIEMIKQLITELASSNNDKEIRLVFEGSMAELVRILAPELKKEGARKGVKFILGGNN